MLFLLVVTSLAFGAYAEVPGIPYCSQEMCGCSEPRDSNALGTIITLQETDPETGVLSSCVCHCGKAENEGCVLGQCGYGLRCLHSKHTHTNGGNICRPLCLDPSEYRGTTYQSCEIDVASDAAIVVPRILTCSDYESPVSAIRTQSDGHIATMTFPNPCEMSNSNARLIGDQDFGGFWEIEYSLGA